MNSKRGILGGIIATFVATIVILIILVIFVFASGIVKKAAGVEGGVKVVSEEEIGIDNIFGYLHDYREFVEVKILVRQGKTYEDARGEVGYGG